MSQIKLIRELNDGNVHLVELSSGVRILIYWDEQNEDHVDFRFYQDNTKEGENECELENEISGLFTFINPNAEEEFQKSKTGYKLIYMHSPLEFSRMGIGEYVVRWFLGCKHDCSYIFASDPNDLTIRDGSEVTGEGIYFLGKMQRLKLIQETYLEDSI